MDQYSHAVKGARFNNFSYTDKQRLVFLERAFRPALSKKSRVAIKKRLRLSRSVAGKNLRDGFGIDGFVSGGGSNRKECPPSQSRRRGRGSGAWPGFYNCFSNK
jgi:hypothetical protein